MATREATFTESDSVVEAKPRIREEVREELREEIKLLEMPRIAAADKLRAERQAVQGAVGEVELFERAYRRATSETLAEIERAVDAMGTGPAPRPIEARPPAPTATRPPSSLAVSDAPAPGATPVLGPRLAPSEVRAIEAHVGGQLLRTEVLFNTTRSRVVEVAFRRDGAEQHVTVVVGDDDSVATLDEIGRKLDGMMLPAAAPEPSLAELSTDPVLRIPVERLSDSERRAPIETVEGIGSAYGAQLRQAGIAKVEQFFLADPSDVAERSGISPGLVRKWHDQVQLQAIDGVGPQFSELLVRAGVRDLRVLADAKPAALAKQLKDYEASLERRVQGRTITSELTENWIAQAKDIVAGAPVVKRDTPATLPKSDLGAEGQEDAEEAPPKKFGLKLGKKREAAEGAPEPPPQADAPPKKKFGLKLGKKKDAAEAPMPSETAAAAIEAAPEASPDAPAEPAAPAKKKFGLSFGKKKDGAAATPAPEPDAPADAPAEPEAEVPEPKTKFGLKLGRKKDEAPEPPAGGEAAEGAEAPKKRFGLKLRK